MTRMIQKVRNKMIKKFFLTAAAAAALAAGVLPAQADVQFESKHQEECAIWLCLPVGFAPAECSKPHQRFRERVFRKHPLSPAPKLSSCKDKDDGNDEGFDISFDTVAYVPAHRECVEYKMVCQEGHYSSMGGWQATGTHECSDSEKSSVTARKVYAQPRECLAWRNVPAQDFPPPCIEYSSSTGPKVLHEGCVMTTRTAITQYGQQVGKAFYEADYQDGTGAQADFSDEASADTTVHTDDSCKVDAGGSSKWCR